ncbi:MAG: HIT family protein [Chloroflexota bacterium]
MNACPFCSPQIYDDAIGDVLLENEHALFLSGPQPVLNGSGLIVPRTHRETVFDLTPDEWQATYSLLHQVKARLDEIMQPDGYNVGWNCGRVGGQSVFHAHLHVIPRFADEPLAGRGIRWRLKQADNQRPE